MNTTRAAHTPGPLETHDVGFQGQIAIVDPRSGFVLGHAFRDVEPGLVAPAAANATLWAAAPDLLAALQMVATKTYALHFFPDEHAQINTAIAKATGLEGST